MSCTDGNGDGVGDFPGPSAKLDYLQELGVNALWPLPFHPSPMRDDGHDISDYRGIYPAFGAMENFRKPVDEMHRRGLSAGTKHHHAVRGREMRRGIAISALSRFRRPGDMGSHTGQESDRDCSRQQARLGLARPSCAVGLAGAVVPAGRTMFASPAEAARVLLAPWSVLRTLEEVQP